MSAARKITPEDVAWLARDLGHSESDVRAGLDSSEDCRTSWNARLDWRDADFAARAAAAQAAQTPSQPTAPPTSSDAAARVTPSPANPPPAARGVARTAAVPAPTPPPAAASVPSAAKQEAPSRPSAPTGRPRTLYLVRGLGGIARPASPASPAKPPASTSPPAASRTAKLAPAALAAAIPDELKKLPRWVARRAKVPLHPVRETNASAGVPATWGTFEDALGYYERHLADPDAGIGFEFAREDGLVGIDLDRALDEIGAPLPWAAKLMEPFLGGAWIEVSPSGRGVHIVTRGTLPCPESASGGRVDYGGIVETVGGKEKRSGVEAYRERRYFTATGRIWRGCASIGDGCQGAIDDLLAATGLGARLARSATPDAPAAGAEPHRAEEVRSALAKLDPDLPYPDWIAVGMAIKAGLGDAGRDLWVDWCGRGSKYVPGEPEEKWSSFNRTGVGLGTLFKRAKDAGWQFPEVSAAEEFEGLADDEFSDLLGDGHAALAGVPKDAHRAVRLFLDEQFTVVGRGTLRYWRGAYYRWTGTHWTQMEAVRDAEVELEKRVVSWILSKGETPTTKVLTAMMRLLRSEVFLEMGAVEDGGWLGAEPPPAPIDQLIPLRNGLFDWTTRTLHPHTPDFFNLNVRGFGWDPDAAAPLWVQTLGEWFGDDRGAIEALQEMIAYVVSGRTDMEKAFYLYGPPRSGRSTVSDVLTALVGAEHTAESTLKQLGEAFGLDNLPGRRLVMFRDARQGRLDDKSAATAALLKITGRDPIPVNRKNRDKWTGRINAVIVIVSNVMAKVHDVSGAIATRLLVIKFPRSFLGREDPARKTDVLAELPGIFRWSLEGLARLAARGRLVQPESGADEAGELGRSASPVGDFVEDALQLDPDAYVTEDDLYFAWRSWADRNGHLPGSKDGLVQAVLDYALARQVPVRRRRLGRRTERRARGLEGVKVREAERDEP